MFTRKPESYNLFVKTMKIYNKKQPEKKCKSKCKRKAKKNKNKTTKKIKKTH